MGKGKLSKFEEMKAFPNVFQPEFDEVFNKDFHLKGSWTNKHFGNFNPLILELGCGKGEYTIGLAQKYPGINFIGIDIKGARIWKGAKKAHLENIANVAFVRTRIEFIKSFFGRNEVEEVWITFPDPQLKKRRNKKRLTSARFLNSYRDFMVPGGIVHLKTDNAVMYHYTLNLVKENNLEVLFSSEDLYGSGQADIVHGIKTFYEAQFIEEGLNINYLKFRLPENRDIFEPGIDDEEIMDRRKNISDPDGDFFTKVYEVVRLIPPGRVTSYGAIARYIGSPQASRMVGWAMNGSHTQKKYVPAHRVVNRFGMLSGKHHFGGSRVMEELLISEGILVEDDKVLEFEKHFWDPNAELI